jgi:hypothetical protein
MLRRLESMLGVTAALVLGWRPAEAVLDEDPFAVTVAMVAPEGQAPRLTVQLTVPEKHYLYVAEVKVTVDGDLLTPIDPPAWVGHPESGEIDPVYPDDVCWCLPGIGPEWTARALRSIIWAATKNICFMPQTRYYVLDGQRRRHAYIGQ